MFFRQCLRLGAGTIFRSLFSCLILGRKVKEARARSRVLCRPVVLLLDMCASQVLLEASVETQSLKHGSARL